MDRKLPQRRGGHHRARRVRATRKPCAAERRQSYRRARRPGIAALWVGHFGITAIRKSLQSGETVQDRFVALLQETSWQPPGFDTSEFGAGIVDAVKLLKHGLQPQAA